MAHIYNKDGKILSMEKSIRGEQGAVWSNTLSNERGQLFQGNKYGAKWTDICDFIKP